MQAREVEREATRRAWLLWQKIKPGRGVGRGWTIAEVLAYVQGKAWDRADKAARLADPANVRTAVRVERIQAGIRAMIAELEACLAALEVEP